MIVLSNNYCAVWLQYQYCNVLLNNSIKKPRIMRGLLC